MVFTALIAFCHFPSAFLARCCAWSCAKQLVTLELAV
jgi:hypothetical protein